MSTVSSNKAVRRRVRTSAVAFLMFSAGAIGVHAQLYLDVVHGANNNTLGIAADTIVWDASTVQWNTNRNGNKMFEVAWTNPNTAIFNAGAGTYTMSLASAIQVNGLTVTTGNVTVSAGGGSLALADNATFDVASGTSLTVSAGFSGAFNLTKASAGSLTLSGANTYSGSTTISAGTLNVSAGSNISTGALSVANGATLTLNNAAQSVSSLSGSGTIHFGSGHTLTVAQAEATSSNYSGTISAIGASLAKSGGGTLTLSGGSGIGVSSVVVSGGTLRFYNPTSSAATVGSATVHSGGTLDLGITNALGVGATHVTLSGGTLSSSFSQVLNTLNVTQNSSISFGGGSNTISFAGADLAGNTVNVANYFYNGGSGTKLQIPNLGSSVSLFEFGGVGSGIYGAYATDMLTIVPFNDLAAIPEPSTYAAIFGGVALAGAIYRRRRKALASSAPAQTA